MHYGHISIDIIDIQAHNKNSLLIGLIDITKEIIGFGPMKLLRMGSMWRFLRPRKTPELDAGVFLC